MFACLPGAPRGRHERLKKRSKTALKKTQQKRRKTRFLEAPGQASKKAPQKPRKSYPREAKMTPRSGPGGAGSDPRAPKTTPRRPQERPKSAPRVAQRRSQSSLGGHLGPIWRPRGSRSPPGRPLDPLGLDFGASGAPFSKLPALLAERFLRSLPGSKRKRKSTSTTRKRRGPRAKDSRQKRPQGLKDSGARRE